MSKIHVTVGTTPTITCDTDTTVAALMPETHDTNGLPFVAALVNNDLVSLSYPLMVNSVVTLVTAASPHGWRVLRRSLCFLLAKAVHDVYPDATFSIEHSFGPGLFCNFALSGRQGIEAAALDRIEARMLELIDHNRPIERRKASFVDAVREFEANGMVEKVNLLRYRNPPRVVLHWCDAFCDLAHGPLVPRTGLLGCFKLLPYAPGFVLHLPERHELGTLPPFTDQPHLFQIFQEHKQWGRILGVTMAGTLNQITYEGKVASFIRTAEALHEKKLGRIADQITESREQIRVILVAGPSSAGKTTFAKRLSTHLRVNGLHPRTLATDDYFVGEDRNPLGDDGKPDYEHIEAVDLAAFNRDLLALIEGRPIRVRQFDFETKQPQISDDEMQLHEREVLIIEGIHGLNPRLTEMIPQEQKFKIYVNALTQLNLDTNNRISTTDNRLMRRLVRDHQFRGHSALNTLRMWPMVRRGEKAWVFPFQQEADATFNSALDYELAVLKPFAEPLLMQIKPSDPEYAESRRLTGFLLNFLAVPEVLVPSYSILREYIGGSSLHY
ncbi:MAG: nucleoside kinase [Verrucomicrobia bacterium]|nr:nucleoside kinase [Verrucomicrobiota bacterium]